MARRRAAAPKRGDATAERLTDLLIVQLGLAGVRQHAIRRIVGCEFARVVRITKELKPQVRRNREDG